MIKDIGQRISAQRMAKGITQEELAELSALSRISIARYETGRIEPSAQALNKIADALETTTDELLGRGDRLSPFIGINRGAVPIVGSIACGQLVTPDTNPEGYADLPEGVSADFALQCKGDSMNPTFIDGDLVLIRQQPEVENGQIAAVGVDGETTLKRIYKTDSGFMLVPDNPAFTPMIFQAVDNFTVFGRAVGYVRLY